MDHINIGYLRQKSTCKNNSEYIFGFFLGGGGNHTTTFYDSSVTFIKCVCTGMSADKI